MTAKKARKYYKDAEFLRQIGLKIRAQRMKHNISQESLANECELDYSQVNRMELGKVNFNVSNLKRLASALQVPPQELLP